MLCLFDLDGTLIDSKEDLVISVNATLAHLGRAALPPELIGSYVGHGAAVLVRRALEANLEDEDSARQAEEALGFFLRYYRQHSLAHTRAYPEIPEALAALKAGGHTLAVLTNKPVRISQDILSALKLADFFVGVIGGDSLPQKKPDPAGVFEFMTQAASPAAETIMIGDSPVDVETARNAKAGSIGVLWGFQPESLSQLPPDMIVEHANQLPAAVERLGASRVSIAT